MDKMGKIMIHILEVGHNLVYFGVVEHEGPSRGELDVPGNFVQFDRANDVAALVGALLQMILPPFLHALFCGDLAVSGSEE